MDPNTSHLIAMGHTEEVARADVQTFNAGIDVIIAFLDALPPSRAKSLARTKLDECVLWTTQALQSTATSTTRSASSSVTLAGRTEEELRQEMEDLVKRAESARHRAEGTAP